MVSPASHRPLLGRYVDPLIIRARPSFRLLAARRSSDGCGCVVATAGEKANRAAVATAFEEVERFTSQVEHPRVARVSARGTIDGEPFLEFDFDAIADGHDMVELLTSLEVKQPYGPADSLIASLRMAIFAGHAVTDPRVGGPLCFGRIGLSNVLFSAGGRWTLIGFGRNFLLEREDGVSDPTVPHFQAPELATGGRPSPTGDYVSLVLLMRSLLPWVDMSGGVGRILRGEIEPADLELIRCLQWTEEHMVGCIPSMRASLDEALQMADRIRELQGTKLDEGAYTDFLRALFARAEEPSLLEGLVDGASAQTLTIGPDAAWVAAPDGSRHRLGPAHRRILLALAERHEADPVGVLTIWDLLDAGWPGEAPVADSGMNRVYVALTRLRQLGLRDIIERFDDGYRLAAGAVVRRAA